MNQTLKELVKYGIVGGIGALVDFGIYYLLTSVFFASYPIAGLVCDIYESLGVKSDIATSNILISSFIGQFFGAVNNFILNGYFTFKVSDNKLKRFMPYLLVFFLGIIISTLSLTIMLDYMGIDNTVAKIVAMVVVAMVQFTLNKFVVFKKKEEKIESL
ncbi:GtrA family protein [Dysgonomonas sp. 520]|uniref:GtrA family protein n=1 Tax=Dysgonomonas sp. 520 TaxID=2302931 RepID=UPI0013D60DA0|nr:GtrA family protein [Dysgonomonas sp. 520]